MRRLWVPLLALTILSFGAVFYSSCAGRRSAEQGARLGGGDGGGCVPLQGTVHYQLVTASDCFPVPDDHDASLLVQHCQFYNPEVGDPCTQFAICGTSPSEPTLIVNGVKVYFEIMLDLRSSPIHSGGTNSSDVGDLTTDPGAGGCGQTPFRLTVTP